MNHLERAENVMRRINELASISEDETGITRTYSTPAFMAGRTMVKDWMDEAGLHTTIDTIGNLRGRLQSGNLRGKTFVIASHIDTVVNAGRFDGPLGVLMGLDLLETLAKSKTKLPFDIELIAFCDEEGCRFHTTYLGSTAVAGTFDKKILSARDGRGISLEEVIKSNGGNVNNLSKDAIAKEDWLGYFEIHIEQGPVLYERNIPVGIVGSIAGQRRVEVRFVGEAGHGTGPNEYAKRCIGLRRICIGRRKFANEHKKKLVARWASI